MKAQIGISVVRKEAWDKVTGAAKYVADLCDAPLLHAKLCVSPHAHAEILEIDTAKARNMAGVKAVITGKDCPVLTGELLQDRYALARDRVRYFGEPVAVVVAEEEGQAKAAAREIKVVYKPLPAVLCLREALRKNSVLVHENVASYTKTIPELYPKARSNIAHVKK